MLWLKVCKTNNDPVITGKFYLDQGGVIGESLETVHIPVNHLRQYTFRIFNRIVAQCISITIPASPNLVPRLVEPMVGILGPPIVNT